MHSRMRTPGMTGFPGKWPWKNGSLTETVLRAVTLEAARETGGRRQPAKIDVRLLVGAVRERGRPVERFAVRHVRPDAALRLHLDAVADGDVAGDAHLPAQADAVSDH